MANGIEISRINRVKQNEGYSDTINPSSFVNSFNGMIQAGQQIQNFAGQANNLLIKQKRLADSLSLDDLLTSFDSSQKENEMKLDAFVKKNPSNLIDPNDGKSLLANQAYALGSGSQQKLLLSDQFNNLGKDYQERFRNVTQGAINNREIKAKFDTTKLLHSRQILKDEKTLDKVLSTGNDPQVTEKEFMANIAAYKTELEANSKEMGIYSLEQLDVALTNVDTKALKLQYGKAKLDATQNATPEGFRDLDLRLQKGDFGIVPPEDLPGKRAELYRGFVLSLTAREARQTKIQTEKENGIMVEYMQQLQSGEHSEEGMTNLLQALGDGILKNNPTKYSQLETDLRTYYKPESESPNSMNRITELNIARVDLNSPNAIDEYNEIRKDLPTLGLSAGQEAARTKQINALTNKINTAEAKADASHKKDMKRRIDQKLRDNKSPLTSILGGNQGTLKNVAEDTFEQLILLGDPPDVAWKKIDDILEQAADGFELNVNDLETHLGVDIQDLQRRQLSSPQGISDEELRSIQLYLAAKKANAERPISTSQTEEKK